MVTEIFCHIRIVFIALTYRNVLVVADFLGCDSLLSSCITVEWRNWLVEVLQKLYSLDNKALFRYRHI